MNQQAVSTRSPWHTIRRTELDWLRVLAFGLLILYHVGMLYAQDWGWHYKSSYSSEFLPNIMLWSNQWRMLLLFFISGVAVSYLLERMPYWRFFRTRLSKILVPLLFGMTVVVVPQVYVELSSKGQIAHLSYNTFWLAYIDQTSPLFDSFKTIGSLHLTWNHLWFLAYIFAYSLILWATFPLINTKTVRHIGQKIDEALPKSFLLFTPILAFFVIGELLYDHYPTTHAFWGDWYNHAKSFFSFLLGFSLVRANRLWSAMINFRWIAFIAAIASYGYIVFAFNGGRLGDGLFWETLNGFIWSANSWLWMLTLIAWAQHGLRFRHPLLQYLNGGVYCFYILHQTIIIVLAYIIVPLQLGAFIEPSLIILSTAIICWWSYEILKRTPILSMCFGVKQLSRHSKGKKNPSLHRSQVNC